MLQSLEDDGVYQGATLLRYNEAAIQFCADQASADLNRLDESMRDRLEWSNMKMLRALMVYLDSQGWSANEVDRSMMENSDADSEDTEDFVLQNILKAADYIIYIYIGSGTSYTFAQIPESGPMHFACVSCHLACHFLMQKLKSFSLL